jgi:hypothetical protein
MKYSCCHHIVSTIEALILTAVVVYSSPVAAASLLHCPDLALFLEHGGPDVPENELMKRLRKVENTAAVGWSYAEKSSCYKRLADIFRENGSFQAEPLYIRAVELSQEHPERLQAKELQARMFEALGRYYRTYRGSEGLFAESEDYYLRAEGAISDAIEVASAGGKTPGPALLRLREEILRGVIALHVREGLGLVIPSRPEERFGIYYGNQIDYGNFPASQNDLVSELRRTLDNVGVFRPRAILRKPNGLNQHHHVRIRFGEYPYVDFGWHDIDRDDAIANDRLPGEFKDFDLDEFEVAVEDTFGMAPVADVLWRFEYRRGDSHVEGPGGDEDFDRFTGLTTLTRSFGRLKANLDLVGSYASVDPENGAAQDDWIVAAGLRLLHFPDLATTERRIIDTRGYEYVLGFVQHGHEYGDGVKLFQETFYGGIKLAEILRRTDVTFLSNFFRHTVDGKSNLDSSDLELNLILTHRILDFVNNMEFRQAERPIGIAQWGAGIRLFEDISTQGPDDYESRGAVFNTFVEFFSGPANRSSAILELVYELRDYHEVGEVQHLFRLGFRLGF